MNIIDYSIVDKDSAFDEVITYIKRSYDKKHVEVDAETHLNDFLEPLKDNLSVLIEYPYVDKFYRDSFYAYFSSKHKTYYRDCIRLTFFEGNIDFDSFNTNSKHQHLQNIVRGYLIIRPTFPKIIGRSLIDKRALKDSNFICCQVKNNITVRGVKLDIEGFPHCSQDEESVSCAETTLWSLMEYFGTRYPDYSPTSPSQIVKILNRYSDQRLLPSSGLSVKQMSYALKEFGFGTYVYSRDDDAYGEELNNIISIYIESGIPLIAFIKNASIAHAVIIFGHERDVKVDFRSVKTKKLVISPTKTKSYFDCSDTKQKYLVQDDNLTPYKLISLDKPVEHYDSKGAFKGSEIASIIVPLYKKIYLEADKAKQLALYFIKDPFFQYDVSTNFVLRFFLTSSRSFKSHISKQNRLNTVIRNSLIGLTMPKFIWCAEIYEDRSFNKNKATGLIIIDATEASANKEDALIFMGHPSKIWLKIGDDFIPLAQKFKFYTKFVNNLS